MRAFVFAICIVGSSLIGLVAACSSSSSSGPPGGNDGGSSGTVDAASAKGGGAITLSSTGAGSTFSAAFANAAEVTLPSCTRTTLGKCTVNECPVGPVPDAGTFELLSAGGITVTGGVIPPPGITVQPGANGAYATQGLGALWAGGETITFIAAGAQVPGFTQTAIAPGPIDISSPTLPAPSGVNVSRSRDFTITWATGTVTGGAVAVTIGSANASTNNSIFCTFDAAAKTGTVPASALGKMPGATGSLFIGVSSQSQMLQNAYLITVTLGMPARANGVDLTVDFLNFQ